jgi:hypothetical protein
MSAETRSALIGTGLATQQLCPHNPRAMKPPPLARWPRWLRRPIILVIAVMTSPIWVPYKVLAHFRRDRMLKGAHDEADRLFYLQNWKELAGHCEGMLWYFPGDEKLTLLWAIALADSDPEKAALLAERGGLPLVGASESAGPANAEDEIADPDRRSGRR